MKRYKSILNKEQIKEGVTQTPYTVLKSIVGKNKEVQINISSFTYNSKKNGTIITISGNPEFLLKQFVKPNALYGQIISTNRNLITTNFMHVYSKYTLDIAPIRNVSPEIYSWGSNEYEIELKIYFLPEEETEREKNLYKKLGIKKL